MILMLFNFALFFTQQAAKMAASNRTPSPWQSIGSQTNHQQQMMIGGGGVGGNNILSPISPAAPSPYGVVVAPGPSPAAGSTCSSAASEHVSSSTQVCCHHDHVHPFAFSISVLAVYVK